MHASLKKLLREVIRTHDHDKQLKNLGRVYAWFMRRLEAVGMASGQDKEEEEIFLNPNKIEEIQQRKLDRDQELRVK